MSSTAIEIINKVNYVGYDALKPFLNAQQERYFPYTPHWQGIAALSEALKIISDEGFDECFNRHVQIAHLCREALTHLGVKLFPATDAVPSPTVTAAYLPEGFNWLEFDNKLRTHGVVIGGNYGELEGKVFRIGHMGSQANVDLVNETMKIIEKIINNS